MICPFLPAYTTPGVFTRAACLTHWESISNSLSLDNVYRALIKIPHSTCLVLTRSELFTECLWPGMEILSLSFPICKMETRTITFQSFKEAMST